jgi:hypothetical protein
MPNNNEIRPTEKAGLKDIIISRLDPHCAYRCFPEDTAHAILFRDALSMTYRNLIKIVKSRFQENRHYVSYSLFEGPYFGGLECSYSPDIGL